MQTCVERLALVGQTDFQVVVSQVIESHLNAQLQQTQDKASNTESNLWRLASTCVWISKNFRLLGGKFDFDQSECKSSQAIASIGKLWPNEVTSFQLVITFDFVWPRLKVGLDLGSYCIPALNCHWL